MSEETAHAESPRPRREGGADVREGGADVRGVVRQILDEVAPGATPALARCC